MKKIFITGVIAILFLSCRDASKPKENNTLASTDEKVTAALDSMMPTTDSSMPVPEDLVTTFQDLTWSPDGRTIYFSGMWHKPDYSDYKPEKWNIYKYELGSNRAIRIVEFALYVAVSPSGNQIAVGKRNNGNWDLFLADTDGRILRQLTFHPADDYAASFSPDGSKLVFNSKRDGKSDIFMINTDATDLKKLMTKAISEDNYNPQWSPDGKRILFYRSVRKGQDQIFVMNADGSNEMNITNDTLQNYFPGWIDKDRIIYARNDKKGSERIYTMNADGGDNKPLLNLSTYYARISPNGEKIAYVNREGKCISVVTQKGELIENIRFPMP